MDNQFDVGARVYFEDGPFDARYYGTVVNVYGSKMWDGTENYWYDIRLRGKGDQPIEKSVNERYIHLNTDQENLHLPAEFFDEGILDKGRLAKEDLTPSIWNAVGIISGVGE